MRQCGNGWLVQKLRFVEALGRAPHTRSTLSSTRSSLAHRRWRLQGRPRPRPQSSLTGWARSCPSFSGRKILLRRRNPSQVLQCSSPGSVSRWTGGGSRARPRLSPFIAILDFNEGGWVARMVARRERAWAATTSWELPAPIFTFFQRLGRWHRLRQDQMDSGGMLVSSCTTTWHNYIFDQL